MKKKLLVLFCLGVSVILPNLVFADCADVGGYSNFVLQGDNTVILYARGVPFTKFDVQCPIQSTSQLMFLKSSVCDGDDVMVDGSKCTVLNVKSSMN